MRNPQLQHFLTGHPVLHWTPLDHLPSSNHMALAAFFTLFAIFYQSSLFWSEDMTIQANQSNVELLLSLWQVPVWRNTWMKISSNKKSISNAPLAMIHFSNWHNIHSSGLGAYEQIPWHWQTCHMACYAAVPFYKICCILPCSFLLLSTQHN